MSVFDDVLGGAGGASVSWKDKPAGFAVEGGIVKVGEKRQADDFNTGEPRFWDAAKTQPVWQFVIELEEADGETRGLWVTAGTALARAIREGLQASGASTMEPGGRLRVETLGLVPASKPGTEKRDFKPAQYTPPNGAAAVLGAPPSADDAAAAYLASLEKKAGQ